MNLNEARQLVASAAYSRLHEYPPESLCALLEAARTLRDELDRVATISDSTHRLADEIVRDHKRWLADQEEPPSLREGYQNPCQAALDLAELVRRDCEAPYLRRR